MKEGLFNGKGKRYYRPSRYPEIPLSQSDVYVLTQDGDRLDLLANRFYNNSSLWWIIVGANPGVLKGDGFGLTVGIEIRIPAAPSSILQNYYKLNP